MLICRDMKLFHLNASFSKRPAPTWLSAALMLVASTILQLNAADSIIDLQTPTLESGQPSPGKRMKMTFKENSGTELYHVLYLPTDWKEGHTDPVIVEYAGNKYKQGPGTPESCDLGYGLSGGKGVIWVSLPYVNSKEMKNAPSWWGDIDATVAYCKKAVANVCAEYGGDPDKLFIAGFSRGSIACNFIGLHDDEIAVLWRGFICHSHYDGVRNWGYTGADKASAKKRLMRLGDRPQYISHEKSVQATKDYLLKAKPDGAFTFVDLPFPEHTDTWVLRESKERQQLREWFQRQTTSKKKE